MNLKMKTPRVLTWMRITVTVAPVRGVDAVVVNVLPLNRDPGLLRVEGKGETPMNPAGLDVLSFMVVDALVVAVDMPHLV